MSRNNAHPILGTIRAGFSLVEMLTVLVILVLVLSILLPVLGRVRNAAKASQTSNIMKDIGNASSSFTLDQKRPPGYFSPTDMGSRENISLGFTAMQNILLDLSGGIVETNAEQLGNGQPCTPPSGGGPQVVQVGPTARAQVFVDIPTIGNPTQTRRGAVARAYFKPDPKLFVAQCGTNQSVVGTATDKALPSVVDAFGMPILAWVQDDLTVSSTQFAGEISESGRAKFYWASNAAILQATAAGKTQVNQAADSMIGDSPAARQTVTIDTESYQNRVATMMSLLGNPGGGSKPTTGSGPFAPIQARGTVVLHAAGVDGTFLGKNERGGKVAGPYLPYKPNQDTMGTGAFDDIVSAFGN